MPGFNGTGPTGQGPITGRGMGPCNQKKRNAPDESAGERPRFGFWRRGRGRGFWRGFGRGFGR